MEQREFETKYAGREKIKHIDEFTKLLNEACNDANDYGAIVSCSALMMKAAFNLVNCHPNGGITGFQAGCLMWEMVKEFGMFGKDAHLRIINYNDLMYPQYADKFNTISEETWRGVIKIAKDTLAKESEMHPNVKAHMERVAEGILPFGLKIAP